MEGNLLYYGDNLDILRRYIKDETVDLVYLDPPFNSNQDYNVLFAEQDGTRSAAQIQAFGDTWRWDRGSAKAFEETVEKGGRVADVLQAFRTFLGTNDMLAYLSMMAPRLVELKRVMKPTASIYLHCDPTASHYLKVLMDGVFGVGNFKTEIIWKRSSAHSDTKQGRKMHGHIHDTILFYTRSNSWNWIPTYTPYDKEYVETFYSHVEPDTGRRFRLSDLTAARPGGDTSYEWKGVRPYQGRYWAYSRANMENFEREGRLLYAKSGIPSYKRYLDEMPGVPPQDVWTDIPPIGPGAAERLGYPTQKPESLMDRIISNSSNEGDTVLDPFCGCGTTIASAQRLKRRWIGIDITHLAITLIRGRLNDAYGKDASYEVVGEPLDLTGAEALAREDRYQFQWWALGKVGARPAESDQKKGKDRGIDGRLYFREKEGAPMKCIILQVKSGHVNSALIRDLIGTVEREKAAIGAFLTLEEPTKDMLTEAASAGFYRPDYRMDQEEKYPKVQILTIKDLLEGKGLQHPHIRNVTFKKAPKAKPAPKTKKAYNGRLSDYHIDDSV